MKTASLAAALLCVAAVSAAAQPPSNRHREEGRRDWEDCRAAARKDLARLGARVEAYADAARLQGDEARRQAEGRVADLRLKESELRGLLVRFDEAAPRERDALRKKIDLALALLRADVIEAAGEPPAASRP